MKRKLYFIIVPGLFILLIVSFFAFFILILKINIENFERQGSSDIKQFKALINSSAEVLPDYRKLADEQAEACGCRIIIVDMDSYLIADSARLQPSGTGGRFFNANLTAAKEDGKATTIIKDNKSNSLVISVGEIINTLHGSFVISFIYKTVVIGRIAVILLFFFSIVIVLSALLVFFLTVFNLHQYRKPIHKLLQHTRKATGSFGGFSKISMDTNNPDLLQLTEDFNSLIDRYDLLINSDNLKYSKINSLMSHIGTGIMVVDVDNSVSLINPRAEELLYIDKGSLFSGRSDYLSEKEFFKKVLEECEMVNSDKRTRVFTLETTEGIIIDISAEAMFSKYEPYEHRGVLVLIRDVTEMRRLEKLKDEFVSNVSHELRTPLTVINGFVQTLQSWETLDEKDRKTSLTIIDVETERLKKLISELLMFSRIEGEMDTTDSIVIEPAVLLSEVILSLSPIAEKKNIVLHLETEKGKALKIRGKVSWFKNIAINLIDNAVKYSPSGSAVEIGLTELENEGVCLTVKDNGIGIPEDEIPRIFERFYRVDKSRNSRIGGSGLGLAITALMVEEFKGTIKVESKINMGSEFIVTIPYHHELHATNL